MKITFKTLTTYEVAYVGFAVPVYLNDINAADQDKEIIKVNKFTELLDIHDNLQLPIIYYSINKHQKCYLYINHGNIIYLMIVKSVDLEEQINEK
jgi:hypothetical protein